MEQTGIIEDIARYCISFFDLVTCRQIVPLSFRGGEVFVFVNVPKTHPNFERALEIVQSCFSEFAIWYGENSWTFQSEGYFGFV